MCSCGKDQVFCCFLGTELQSLLQCLIVKSHHPRKAFLLGEVLAAKSWRAALSAQLGQHLGCHSFAAGLGWDLVEDINCQDADA